MWTQITSLSPLAYHMPSTVIPHGCTCIPPGLPTEIPQAPSFPAVQSITVLFLQLPYAATG